MDDRIDVRLKTSAVDTAHRVAPWRPDIAWWVVAIQGLVALALGLLLLLNQGAGEPVVALLGLVLLLIAIGWAWTAMRSDLPQTVLGWRGMRAGVGIVVGAMLVLDILVDFLSASAALTVLSLGLLLVGAFGAAEWFAGRERLGWRWPSLIGPGVAAAFGLIVLLSRLQAAPVFLQVLAAAAVVLGVVLLVRAGLLLRQDRLLGAASAPVAGSSNPTPIAQASAGAAAPTVTVRSAGSAKPGDGPTTGGSAGSATS